MRPIGTVSWLLLLPGLIASSASGVQLRADAVSSLGGDGGGGTRRIGSTVGLSVQGTSSGPSRFETAGFWFPRGEAPSAVDRLMSDVPGAATGLDCVAPNPVRGIARVRYRVAGSAGARVAVRLALYDPTGRQVATLFDGEASPGLHWVEWRGTSERGMPLAAGRYYLRLSSAARSESRSILWLR